MTMLTSSAGIETCFRLDVFVLRRVLVLFPRASKWCPVSRRAPIPQCWPKISTVREQPGSPESAIGYWLSE